jgi:phosphopantothenoylcysteine decarboxylase/phosphopantothenate--cysteine ligase
MRIALGVSGGIAAYKAAELVRLLQDKGLDVQVVMTRSAREFITPLTFAALSRHKVITEMFGDAQGSSNVESAIEHIAVAQSIDAFVVAPATANVLAKLTSTSRAKTQSCALRNPANLKDGRLPSGSGARV